MWTLRACPSPLQDVMSACATCCTPWSALEPRSIACMAFVHSVFCLDSTAFTAAGRLSKGAAGEHSPLLCTANAAAFSAISASAETASRKCDSRRFTSPAALAVSDTACTAHLIAAGISTNAPRKRAFSLAKVTSEGVAAVNAALICSAWASSRARVASRSCSDSDANAWAWIAGDESSLSRDVCCL